MNFTELKTKITTLLDRADYDVLAGQFINAAIQELEQSFDWRQMETEYTGSITTSVDYIPMPTRYESCAYLIITSNNRQKFLLKQDYAYMISKYPHGNSNPSEPKVFATKQSASRFIVRPYPEKTYTYELCTRSFSADLSDTNPTNFWMVEMWLIVFYGALIQYELDSGKKLQLGTEEFPLSPGILYQSLYAKLTKKQIDERRSRAPLYRGTDWVV